MPSKLMQGLYLSQKQASLRTDLPIPVLKGDEALIKVQLAGVCSTDLEMVRGYYPFEGIMGHEFVGEVLEAPSCPSMIGKRVAGSINISCGICEACLKNRRSHCENRNTLGIWNYDGVFAECTKLPVENLFVVPDNVTDKEAVFTEPLAAALEITEQVHIRPTDKVCVVGAGRLGLLIAQVLKLTGCQLVVVVRRKEPARMLHDLDIKSMYAEELAGSQFDMVVEVTGSKSGYELSRSLVRPAGTLVLKSTFADDVLVNLSKLVVDEIQVVGSRCGPFAPALELMSKRLINTEVLVHKQYPLARGMEALEEAAKPGVLKVLIKP